MGEPQRRVLRRKRQQIVSHLVDPRLVVSHLHQDGILTDSYVDMLQSDKMDGDSMLKLVDILCLQCPSGFDSLCRLLESQSPWLREELLADLRAETGTLEIDETIRQEAAELVHRRFGTSRRFSQGDKKEIALIIATKVQVVKEGWKRHMEKTEIDLKRTTEILRHTEEQIMELNAKIKRFVRHNEFSLAEPFLDMKSTTDVLSVRGQQKSDPIKELDKRVDFLLCRILRSMTLKENGQKKQQQQQQQQQQQPDKAGSLAPGTGVSGYGMETGSKYVDSLKRKIYLLEEEMKRKTCVLEKQKMLLKEKDGELETLRARIAELETTTCLQNNNESTEVTPLDLQLPPQNGGVARTGAAMLPAIASSPVTTPRLATSRPHRCDHKCLKAKKRQ